jgi:hypothetical protein
MWLSAPPQFVKGGKNCVRGWSCGDKCISKKSGCFKNLKGGIRQEYTDYLRSLVAARVGFVDAEPDTEPADLVAAAVTEELVTEEVTGAVDGGIMGVAEREPEISEAEQTEQTEQTEEMEVVGGLEAAEEQGVLEEAEEQGAEPPVEPDIRRYISLAGDYFRLVEEYETWEPSMREFALFLRAHGNSLGDRDLRLIAVSLDLLRELYEEGRRLVWG